MHDDEYDNEWELNRKRNDDFILIASVTAATIYHRRRRAAYFDKMSCRTNKLQGANGNYVQIPKMVGMFLFTLGHCARNRLVQECFQYYGETVTRMFHKVLYSVYLLSLDIIKPRENRFDEVPVKIRGDPKYSPFKNCVGAINGTHIPAVIPKPDRGRFIGRKGTMTQNVMAACDFDMLYIFVSAGWEGSTHDVRVFQYAISTPKLRFPMPPRGKYYLVDAGYPNRTGFLAPYKGGRYHLSQFENGHRATSPREVYNHTHSSLRSVIERIFGVTKNRFPILRKMSSYPYETHVQIVIACMTLHNFILLRVTNDEEFTETDEGASSSSQEPTTENVVIGVDDLRDDRTMSSVRDKITDKLVRRRQR
ncbi:uncharacterized protein LOC119985544 [Tripterygium wilfordii]|uniref:uncharacterized protein LOC119985544 n=1 Tax=Tripterygium wilfordii TaxID=458696 RepID=UPI0018F7FF3F|nr:uncharacterized protein LOC119985544 [Tripterygium wilfordii]